MLIPLKSHVGSYINDVLWSDDQPHLTVMAAATLSGFPYSIPQQVSVTYQPPERPVFLSSLCCHLHLLLSNPWNASDFQSSLFLLSSTERGFCISKWMLGACALVLLLCCVYSYLCLWTFSHIGSVVVICMVWPVLYRSTESEGGQRLCLFLISSVWFPEQQRCGF